MTKKIASPPPSAEGSPRSLDDSALQGKMFPPDSPVDVPNLPRPQAADPCADEVGKHGEGQPAVPQQTGAPPAAPADSEARPVAVDTTRENWADSTQPAPDKRNARSHNI